MVGSSDSDANRLTFVGHSTVLIELDGARILTDPLLRGLVLFLRRRCDPVPRSIVEGVDAVLISHLHRDHCDIASLRRLAPGTRILVPRGAASVLRKAGLRGVEELPAGESVAVGALRVEATTAVHSGFRPPLGPSAEAAGFLIEGSTSIYFAGDTAMFDGMAALAGRADLALLPVWGWGPNLRGGHMNPEQAAECLDLIQPKRAIPIHWGTYYPAGLSWFRRHLLHEPPGRFAAEAARRAPGVAVEVLQPGGSTSL